MGCRLCSGGWAQKGSRGKRPEPPPPHEHRLRTAAGGGGCRTWAACLHTLPKPPSAVPTDVRPMPLPCTHAAIWSGTVVALKVLVLPPQLTRNERRQQMALMEAAISSAMSHPNIVQVWAGPRLGVGGGGAGEGARAHTCMYNAACRHRTARPPPPWLLAGPDAESS